MNTHSRVLSGMRPTGRLHLGHYHGVLKNWVELQHEYSCFFFVADWHALTTHYENPTGIPQSTHDMVIDWLAAGVNPNEATIFIQSRVPEHAELHLLLSMITPLGWLERVPSYKDQQERLKEMDLSTYGFLGYPLLQSADILVYRAGLVPVGEDQVVHVELTREVARRFNHIYGREPDFEEKAEQAAAKAEFELARQQLEAFHRDHPDSVPALRLLARPELSLEDVHLMAPPETRLKRAVATEVEALVIGHGADAGHGRHGKGAKGQLIAVHRVTAGVTVAAGRAAHLAGGRAARSARGPPGRCRRSRCL